MWIWMDFAVRSRRRAEEPFQVLSVENGSPEYDAKIARYLHVRRPSLNYVIVSTNTAYRRLFERNPDLRSYVTVVESTLADWDGTVPRRRGDGEGASGEEAAVMERDEVRGGFDLVHCALWRQPDWGRLFASEGTEEGPTELEAVESLLSQCRPGGTLLAFRFVRPIRSDDMHQMSPVNACFLAAGHGRAAKACSTSEAGCTR